MFAVKTFLERNGPTVLVIVSSSTENIPLSEFESQIVNEGCGPHAGRLVYLHVEQPPVSNGDQEAVEFWKTNYHNQNLQRLSTFAGLSFAQSLGIPIALKCRSDSFLAKINVCDYLNDKFLKNATTQRRIVSSDHTRSEDYHLRVPAAGRFHIADLWLFGSVEDLVEYFDMRKESCWDEGRGVSTEHAVETNLAEFWIRNARIFPRPQGLRDLIERGHLAIADSVDVEYLWMHTPHDYEQWTVLGKDYLTYSNSHAREDRIKIP